MWGLPDAPTCSWILSGLIVVAVDCPVWNLGEPTVDVDHPPPLKIA